MNSHKRRRTTFTTTAAHKRRRTTATTVNNIVESIMRFAYPYIIHGEMKSECKLTIMPYCNITDESGRKCTRSVQELVYCDSHPEYVGTDDVTIRCPHSPFCVRADHLVLVRAKAEQKPSCMSREAILCLLSNKPKPELDELRFLLDRVYSNDNEGCIKRKFDIGVFLNGKWIKTKDLLYRLSHLDGAMWNMRDYYVACPKCMICLRTSHLQLCKSKGSIYNCDIDNPSELLNLIRDDCEMDNDNTMSTPC